MAITAGRQPLATIAGRSLLLALLTAGTLQPVGCHEWRSRSELDGVARFSGLIL